MLSIGLHLRMIGRPGRIGGLETILRHISGARRRLDRAKGRNRPPLVRPRRSDRRAVRSLLLINPNTTVAMTEQMAAAARRRLPEGIALEALTAERGAPVIASRASYAVGAEAVLEVYGRARGPHGAVMIGCFGDPGSKPCGRLRVSLSLASPKPRFARPMRWPSRSRSSPWARPGSRSWTSGWRWLRFDPVRRGLRGRRDRPRCQPPGGGRRRRTQPPSRRGRRRRRANAHPWRRGADRNGGAPPHGRPSGRLRRRDGPGGA